MENYQIFIFLNLKNQNLAKKICNIRIVCPFDPRYSQFCQFSFMPLKSSQVSFPILVTRKYVPEVLNVHMNESKEKIYVF